MLMAPENVPQPIGMRYETHKGSRQAERHEPAAVATWAINNQKGASPDRKHSVPVARLLHRLCKIHAWAIGKHGEGAEGANSPADPTPSALVTIPGTVVASLRSRCAEPVKWVGGRVDTGWDGQSHCAHSRFCMHLAELGRRDTTLAPSTIEPWTEAAPVREAVSRGLGRIKGVEGSSSSPSHGPATFSFHRQLPRPLCLRTNHHPFFGPTTQVLLPYALPQKEQDHDGRQAEPK